MRTSTYRYVLALLLLAAPASAQPQGPMTPPPTTTAAITSTACPGTGCVVLNVSGFGTAAVQVSAIGTQTLTFEGSLDGTTYQALNATPTNASSAVTTTTTTGLWTVSVAGLKYLRVRGSAYTSGSATVLLQAAAGGGSSGGGGGGGSAPSGTIGAAVPATASPAAVKDNAGNLAYPLLDASGNLLVAVTGAGSGGTSATDGAAYAAGTTAGTPIIGARDDAAVGTVAEDKLGIVRITTNRAQHVNLRDAAGTEYGTAGSPLPVTLANTGANATAVKVDGSAVTQPVSGTVTTTPPANASTNVAQFGGTNVSTGTGTGGAGIPRVTVSSDSFPATQAVSGTVSANAGTGTFTNQQSNVTADYDTGAGTQTTTMFGLALPANGGAVAGGTSTNPLQVSLANTAANGTAVKVDGSAATQPVSGTVTANQGGTWTVQPGNTANTTAWKVDGSAVTQPVSGTVTATQATGTNLHIVCDSGCGGAASFGDNAAFTAGTTAVNNMGAVVDDTSTNAVTEDHAGAPRMSTSRVLYGNLRNASGTEVVTATTTPGGSDLGLVVRNIPSGTQAVSGTVTTTPPSNASENVAQFGGSNVVTGTGTGGAGIPRVTVSSDSFPATQTVTQATASNLKAQVQQLGAVSTSATLQNAATANGNGTVLTVDGYAAAVLTVNCATCSGGTTVNFEVSEDASNFVAIPATQVAATPTMAATTATAGVTVWRVATAGFQQLRARISAYSAGTVTVTGHTVSVGDAALAVTAVQPTAANLNATVTGTVTTTPPSNASTNVAQLAGTTTSVNSGVKDGGTLRVVLATDQPALTNKLLVTPDSVALPANQSVNVNQFGGSAVVTGTGAGGAGIPRMTVSNDSTVTANQGTNNATPWNTSTPDVSASQAISTTTCNVGTASQTGCVIVAAAGRTGTMVSWPTGSTFVGVVVAEASNDSGNTWAATFFDAPATSNKVATASPASGVAAVFSLTPVGGATHYRVRATTATSGSGTFTLTATSSLDPSELSAGANNAAMPPTALAVGFEAQTGAQPTVATAGNMRRAVASTDGVPYFRFGGPVYFTCGFNSIAATLTQMTGCAGGGAGLKYYITDIGIQTTTTTSGTYAIQTGTGSNCGTGTTALWPMSGTANRFNANVATDGMVGVMHFTSPIVTAANVQICVIGVVTNTVSGQISGFIAP